MPKHFTGFAFNLVYVDELQPALDFYTRHFGFEAKRTMKDGSVWGKSGEISLWIGGGYEKQPQREKSTRSSIMYSVPSSGALFAQLKADNVATIQSEPMHMGDGEYWFQFFDPAGNILEVLGGK